VTPAGGWLPQAPENIPPELRAQPYVLWRAESRGPGKPTKVPYRVADPSQRASSTDPATWGTFWDALDAYTALMARPVEPIAGIGVVLTAEAGIVCIDLDNVIGPGGVLDTRAETIVERCGSWTERSPSGTGLHIFVRGTIARALRGNQIEVYGSARYIAVTGQLWPGGPSTLRPAQAYLDHLAQLAAAAPLPGRPWAGPSPPPPDDLAGALLAKLERWQLRASRIRRWADGYLVELDECPWADEHTTGRGGAVVMIHASGAFDFTCLHAHCGGRGWRDFRAVMEAGGGR
jgi:hypothetical protein